MTGIPVLPPFPADDLGYTIRRGYVEEFSFRQAASLDPRAMVLELGGQRIGRRGRFDASAWGFPVVYANIAISCSPDLLADAGSLPFRENSFAAVFCNELLEHLYNPSAAVYEIFRVLHPSGVFIATVPFNVPVHPDPVDYGRYTIDFWRRLLAEVGFADVEIEAQGDFRSVLLDLLRLYALQLQEEGTVMRSALVKGIVRLCRRRLTHPGRPQTRTTTVLAGYTTGYGIVARKPGRE